MSVSPTADRMWASHLQFNTQAWQAGGESGARGNDSSFMLDSLGFHGAKDIISMLKYQQLFQELRVKCRGVGQEGFIEGPPVLSLSIIAKSGEASIPSGRGFTGGRGICLDRIAQ